MRIESTYKGTSLNANVEELYELTKDKYIDVIDYDSLELFLKKDLLPNIKSLSLNYRDNPEYHLLFKYDISKISFISDIKNNDSSAWNLNFNIKDILEIDNIEKKLKLLNGEFDQYIVNIIINYKSKNEIMRRAVNNSIKYSRENYYRTEIGKLIDFLYRNELESYINEEYLDIFNHKIILYEQKYRGKHDYDEVIFNKLIDKKSSTNDFRNFSSNKEYINFVYIINKLKRFNKTNLYRISLLLGHRWKGMSFNKCEDISKEEYDEIFKLLRLKYAKYVLRKDEYANFITTYYEKDE